MSALLTVVLLLGVMVLPVGAASRVEVKTDDYYAIYNAATGKVLNVYYNRSANGTNVDIYDMDYTDSVYWKFTPKGASYVLSPRNATGAALNVYGDTARNGTNVCIWSKTGHTTQSWVVEAVSGGFLLRSTNNTAVVLTATGSKNNSNVNLQTYQPGNSYQIWTSDALSVKEEPAMTQTPAGSGAATGSVAGTILGGGDPIVEAQPQRAYISDGWYTITPKCAPNMRLDVNGGKNADSTNVQIWKALGSNAQKFHVQAYGGGYYTIGTCNDGMLLDVDKGSTAKGTNVQQYHSIISEAQKWTFHNAGDGYVWIVPKVSGSLRLDVDDAGSSNGTNVQVWTKNNTDAQKWKLTPTDGPEMKTETVVEPEEPVKATSDVMVDVPWNLINECGHQPNSGPCQAYCWAYCRIILDKKSHQYTDYWVPGVGGAAPASVGYNDGQGTGTERELLKIVCNEVDKGRPVMLRVTGYKAAYHFVVAIGYKAGCDRENPKTSDILILDPANQSIDSSAGNKATYTYLSSQTISGNRYWTAKSGNSATTATQPAAAQPTVNTESGVWIVTVPAQYYLSLYTNPTDSRESSSIYRKPASYRIKCHTKAAVNGAAWYCASINDHGTDRNYWFKYDGGKMSLR